MYKYFSGLFGIYIGSEKGIGLTNKFCLNHSYAVSCLCDLNNHMASPFSNLGTDIIDIMTFTLQNFCENQIK